MCGISGVAALGGALDPSIRRAIRPMTDALAHRGPDGDGFFIGERVALGHRRLAIIDREGGTQPIANEDGSRWIVFNGEIYNHRALRRELQQRGHRFRTSSDTEVILHAYEEYGPEALSRIEGMFAFAIYDQANETVFIARDRLGKKPLFYATLGDALHFASEIKALYQSPAWDGTIDAASLETYLTLGYILAPATAYRAVRKLEPGHWLRLRNGIVEVRQYWDVDRFDDDRRTGEVLEDAVEAALKGAVEERLESEVPLGAFLSGGIDSGLVVSYMAEASERPVVTTTVGFGHAAHNELDAAAITASHWRTSHHPHVIEPSLDRVMNRVVAAFDEPFADPSAIPTYYVSQIARQHVTVALSGDGGDEVFGGYWFRYVPHALECYARRMVPGAPGRAAVRWAGQRWPSAPWLPRMLRWRTIFGNLARDSATAYFADLCMLQPEMARAVLGLGPLRTLSDSATYAQVTDAYRRCGSPDPVQRAQYADLKIYLPNDVLVKVDRMSMAHSLEVRSPLLDRRIVEAAFRVPQARKMPRLQSKYLLRQIARRRLPASLLSFPKHGFTAPISEWMMGPYRDMVREELFGTQSELHGYADPAVVKHLFDAHAAGAADHSYALWALWVLARWMKQGQQQGRGARGEELGLSQTLTASL